MVLHTFQGLHVEKALQCGVSALIKLRLLDLQKILILSLTIRGGLACAEERILVET